MINVKHFKSLYYLSVYFCSLFVATLHTFLIMLEQKTLIYMYVCTYRSGSSVPNKDQVLQNYERHFVSFFNSCQFDLAFLFDYRSLCSYARQQASACLVLPVYLFQLVWIRAFGKTRSESDCVDVACAGAPADLAIYERTPPRRIHCTTYLETIFFS